MFSIKIILVLLFACSVSVAAQDQIPGIIIEYGDPSELKGVAKIFVNTGPEVELRTEIAKEIRKKLPKLEIVSRPEDAEIHLRYYSGGYDFPEVKVVVEKPISYDRVRFITQLKLKPSWNWLVPVTGPPRFGKEYARAFVKVYEEANRR